jgi:predicted dehydrogenase
LATRLIQAGYPVVVEKPVAGTIQEVDRLITVERQTGRWCAVDYQWLHSPTIQWLRQRIAAGALGRCARDER